MAFPGPYPSKYPQLNEMAFTDEARGVLVHIIRAAFPHEAIPLGPYERMADRIIEMADESTWFRIKLLQGVQTLNDLAGGAFAQLGLEDAGKVLLHVEKTDFFGFIRRSTVLEMYEDEEVWEVLGYEGPSFDQGGYLHRGFDDLDWLPDPRIDEYDGEPLVEVPAGPAAALASATPPVGDGGGGGDGDLGRGDDPGRSRDLSDSGTDSGVETAANTAGTQVEPGRTTEGA